MVKKVVLLVFSLSTLSCCLCILGLNLPMHKVSFFGLKFVRLFRLGTYVLGGKIEDNSNDFCLALGKVKPDFCTDLHGYHNLQDLSHRFCVDVIQTAMPNVCRGTTSAYILGITVFIGSLSNLLLVSLAVYLLWYYSTHSCKRKYWTASLVLVATSTMLYIGVIALYYALVIFVLNNINLEIPIPGASVFTLSAHGGAYYGFLSFVVAMTAQFIIVALMPLCRSEDEIDEQEEQDRKEMKRWLKAHEQTADPHGQQPVQAQPFGGYGATVLGPELQQQPMPVWPSGAGPPQAEKPELGTRPSFR